MSNEIGRRIKNLRTGRGWRQDDLAEKLHVTRQAVSNWENGKTYVSVDYLNACARIFDVSLDELVYGGKAGRREYREMQTKYIIAAAAAAAIMLACLVLHFALRPWCVEQYRNFRTVPYIIYTLSVRGALGLSVPVLLLSAFSLKGDIRIKSHRWRYALLSIGSVLFLLLLWSLLACYAHTFSPPARGTLFFKLYRLVVFNSVESTSILSFIFAVSCFLGLNK